MKAFRTLFVVAAALLSTGLLHAQMEDGPLMLATIPFGFNVEHTHLPAGQYIVSRVDLNGFWKISTPDYKTNVLFHILADPDSKAFFKNSALVFKRDSTNYALHEIREKKQGIVATVYEGKRKKELAQGSSSTLTMVNAQAF